MDMNDVLAALARWIHIGAVIVAVGGVAFMRLALLPAVRRTLDDAKRRELHEAIRSRWAPVVHACLALILLTGAANFYLVVMPSGVAPMPYHALFGIKVLLAFGVFFVASALLGRSPGLEKIRQARARWLTILLVLAALIVLLSVVLEHVRTALAG